MVAKTSARWSGERKREKISTFVPLFLLLELRPLLPLLLTDEAHQTARVGLEGDR